MIAVILYAASLLISGLVIVSLAAHAIRREARDIRKGTHRP